jgi:hypothetical protein
VWSRLGPKRVRVAVRRRCLRWAWARWRWRTVVRGGGGKPSVEGVKVTAEIVTQDRAKKIIVFKMKRRKNYRRKNGHRQPFTELHITGIEG